MSIPNGFYRGPRRFQGVISATGVTRWSLRTDGEIRCIAALGPGGRVYVGTGSMTLYAIDTASGTTAWTWNTGYPITTNSPVVDQGGNVYIPGLKTLSFTPDGVLRWTVQQGGVVKGSAWLGSESDLYFCTSVWRTGDVPTLFRLNTDTGETVWATPFPGLHTVLSTPTEVAGGLICFATPRGTVYGVDKETGAVAVALKVGGRMGCRPAASADGTTVYVITLNDGGTDKLVALDTSSHPWSVAWSSAPEGLTSSPLAEPICTADGEQVYAPYTSVVAYQNGQVVWQSPNVGGAQRMALDGDQNLIIGRRDLHFCALNPEGQLLQGAPVGGSGVGGAVDDDGVVYFGDSGGFVYAYGPQPTPPPLPNGFYRGPTAFLGTGPTAAPRLRWSLSLGGEIRCSPALGPDGRLYIGTKQKNLFAVDTASGRVAWSRRVDYQFDTNTPVVDQDGNVYAPGWNTVSYDPRGAQRWSFSPDGGLVLSSGWLGADGDLYMTSTEWQKKTTPTLYRLDTRSGRAVWSVPFPALSEILSTPIEVAGGLICFASEDGKVYAFNKANGALTVAFNLGAPMTCRPAASADGTTVFVITTGSGANRVVALDTSTLPWTEAWSVTPPGFAPSTLADPLCTPTASRVYAGGRRLVAICDGSVLWQTTEDVHATRLVFDANQTVYVGREDERISAIDDQGRVLWTLDHGNDGVGVAIDDDGVLYVGDRKGTLFAYGS
ncbi:MAG: PQQ-binding-like beta-propeller repeat protein [Alphaproteobacteria bacterium]|nr:PQQ-binding-like beta-propeller repeat protein [Alphaproteobacteria bacterium]